MITKGYLLIQSSNIPGNFDDIVIASSENKSEIIERANELNKKVKDTLKRYYDCYDLIIEYSQKFNDFRYKFNCNLTEINFNKWMLENPILNNIKEFVEITESGEGKTYLINLNVWNPYEYSYLNYNVKSFG